MNRRTVRVLAAIIAGLVLLLLVVERNGNDSPGDRTVLLPGFKAVANDARLISVVSTGEGDNITVSREHGNWIVDARAGYPADVGKLGQLITALADARIVEEKTSNPENYSRLGVDDPGDGGSGELVTVAGEKFSYSLILGNTAQSNSRYARIPDQATSYLIDRSPTLPESQGDWLMPRIIDIPASRVRRVSIDHADGETLVIEKTDEEQTDFDVVDIPEGRELKYATVGNAIAGALAKLELEDVRKRVDAPTETTVEFTTWGGLQIAVEVLGGDDSTWLSFEATAADADAAVAEEAITINGRLAGWQYQVTDYKKNLLVRRWDDLLKAENP